MGLGTYTYALFRYVPDPVRGEAVNLGVVVVSDEERASATEFFRGYRTRMRALNPEANFAVIDRLIQGFKKRTDPAYQSGLMAGEDARLTSSGQLRALKQSMANQLQLSEPKVHRADSLQVAVRELYEDLVAPPERAPRPTGPITLEQLRSLIATTIREWTGKTMQLEESTVEKAGNAGHYADFWLQMGEPVAAFIAIPGEPDDRHQAWLRRDSVPTIAAAFRAVNPAFRAVAVLPPNGRPPTPFIAETQGFLGSIDGVIVTAVDHLDEWRSTIVPAMFVSGE
jgi:hypothetical protein